MAAGLQAYSHLTRMLRAGSGLDRLSKGMSRRGPELTVSGPGTTNQGAALATTRQSRGQDARLGAATRESRHSEQVGSGRYGGS